MLRYGRKAKDRVAHVFRQIVDTSIDRLAATEASSLSPETKNLGTVRVTAKSRAARERSVDLEGGRAPPPLKARAVWRDAA